METRIKINGDWYVKESVEVEDSFEIIYTEEALFENRDYCFAFVKDESSFYIKFRDKSNDKIEVWDNRSFVLSLLDGSTEFLHELNEAGKKLLINSLNQINREKGWIK